MRAAAFRAVLRDPLLVRVVVAFSAFAVSEAATWIGILVYAYERGGVVEVGIVEFLLLAPAAVLAPVAAPLGDRFRRDVVLAAGLGVQALCLAAVATAMLHDADRTVVYAAAALLCAAVTLTRPVVGALLPSLTREPRNLSTANAAIAALESIGGLLGPLIAAGLLLAFGPAAVFSVSAVLMTAAFLAVAHLGLDPRLARPIGDTSSLREALRGGAELLRRDSELLLLVACVAAPSLLFGAVEVLLVGVATEQLGRGTHFAGYLGAVFAGGGVLGAAAAALTVGRRGLGLALCLAGFLAGLPVSGLAAAEHVPAAMVCLLASGAGMSFGGVVGTTLIQRAAPDRFRASVFGVREGLETASLALGGLLVAGAFAWLGLRGTLILVGSLVPVVLMLSAPRLLAIDASSLAPGARILSALRRDGIFAPLPPPDIERLASRAVLFEAEAGSIVTREGDLGDRYFCVLDGDLEVRIAGDLVRTLGRGDAFGELALLHAVPRTATVTALGPSTLIAVDGLDFLEIVTRHPQSLVHATAGTRSYLEVGALSRSERTGRDVP